MRAAFIIAVSMVLALSSCTAYGADQNLLNMSDPAFTAFQGPAATAAKGYASALFKPDTPQFTATARRALNDVSLAIENANPNLRVTTVGPLELSRLDQDARYRTNFESLVFRTVELGTHTDRIWFGLPAPNYTNTVVITGSGGLCTGTIIGKRAVLTAQHCHCGNVNSTVYFGERFDPSTAGIKVQRSVPMKSCSSPTTSAADVALLFLESDVSSNVVPAAVASSSLISQAQMVRLVGYGRDEHNNVGQKLFVDVPVASPNCKGSVTLQDGTKVPDAAYYGCNAEFELVAGAPLLNKDSCNGDSGGPVFVQDVHGNEYLAGATSRAVIYPGARPCGDGGIYVRVDGEVLGWIGDQGVDVAMSP